MGNTPSQQGMSPEQIYAQYIQQQQDLIFQQQQQINKLYHLNMSSQTQANMFLQNSFQQLPQQQLPQQQLPQQQLPQLPHPKQKIDPYKILNLSKTYDETGLKKAYLKAAMKAHPDRGGTPDAFQKVSIAYTLLQKKLTESQNNHSHTDLRDDSKRYMDTQRNQPKLNTKLTEKFDADVFNKIYSDNKIETTTDKTNWHCLEHCQKKAQLWPDNQPLLCLRFVWGYDGVLIPNAAYHGCVLNGKGH